MLAVRCSLCACLLRWWRHCIARCCLVLCLCRFFFLLLTYAAVACANTWHAVFICPLDPRVNGFFLLARALGPSCQNHNDGLRRRKCLAVKLAALSSLPLSRTPSGSQIQRPNSVLFPKVWAFRYESGCDRAGAHARQNGKQANCSINGVIIHVTLRGRAIEEVYSG